MQFKTNPSQSFKPAFKKPETWIERFTSQVHQLFFISAVFFALIIMTLSILALSNKFNLDFSLVHGFGLNYAVFTNAFLGFLLTVMPKYNGTLAIEKKVYLPIFISFEISVLITLFINETIGKVLLALTLFYVTYIFYTILKNSKAPDITDSVLITIITFLGASFLLLQLILSSDLNTLILYSYLLAMVYIVALRMVPGFFYIYTKKPVWVKPKFVRPATLIILLLLGITLQFQIDFLLKPITFISMIFFGYVTFKLKIYEKTPAIISILTLGMLWFEIGMIALFIETFFEIYTLKLSLHIFALGFITTLLIGFGSRVVMGHAIPAQTIKADKFTKFLFIFTQVVLVSRIIASIFFINNSNFTTFLHISAGLWILLFILWSLRYARTLLRL